MIQFASRNSKGLKSHQEGPHSSLLTMTIFLRGEGLLIKRTHERSEPLISEAHIDISYTRT